MLCNFMEIDSSFKNTQISYRPNGLANENSGVNPWKNVMPDVGKNCGLKYH